MCYAEILDICYHKAYPAPFDDSSLLTDQGGVAVVFFQSEFANKIIQFIYLNGANVETILVPGEDPPSSGLIDF